MAWHELTVWRSRAAVNRYSHQTREKSNKHNRTWKHVTVPPPMRSWCLFFSPYVPYASPTRAQAAGRRPAPPRRRLHNDSHQADPTRWGGDRHRKTPRMNATAAGHHGHKRAREWPVRLRLWPGGACGRCGCHLRPVRTTGGICRAGREPERGQERQAYRENEAERSRVRGPRAAAHLLEGPSRRPVGYGGGGARPPAQ